MATSLEKTIAYHCAPALAGIKPSNLANLLLSRYPDCYEEVGELNRLLNEKGIYFKPLLECRHRVLLLVYRSRCLTKHLQDRKIQAYLYSIGYPSSASLDETLTYLGKRIKENSNFPHEIGLFLGYPIEDVLDFLWHRGKNYKLSGYWKVYSNEKRAKKIFNKYTKCRNAVCSSLERDDKSIAKVFGSA